MIDKWINRKRKLGKKCTSCFGVLFDSNKTGLCRACGAHKLSKNRGELNTNFKSEELSLNALHRFVARRLLKTKLCQKCFRVPPYDLANKGIYDRNLENWEWLCRRCHMKSDGRIEALKGYAQTKGDKKEVKTPQIKRTYSSEEKIRITPEVANDKALF